MASFGDITDQYLDKLYEDMQKEQQKLLQDNKSGTDDKKELDNNKQFNIINSIMLNTVKLKNLRKKIKNKIDN